MGFQAQQAATIPLLFNGSSVHELFAQTGLTCRVIASNYSRVRDVERELSQLQLQLKITAGPKRSALEHLRKKIELQNIKVVAARDRNRVAKQVGFPVSIVEY